MREMAGDGTGYGGGRGMDGWGVGGWGDAEECMGEVGWWVDEWGWERERNHPHAIQCRDFGADVCFCFGFVCNGM